MKLRKFRMIAQADAFPLRRPLLVMAYADSQYAALSCRHFRRMGWEVHLACSGPEARRLARTLNASVVVLDAELREESGWLTCDKLRREIPGQKVVLVSRNPTDEGRRFAAFVGATGLVCRGGGPAALADEILGSALPAVG
jgi:DNA-binding response OmpR family regulator